MKVAVFDLYWSTYGGGEQVAGAIAQIMARDHEVTLLGPEPIDVTAMHARLGVDLSQCGFLAVADDVAASAASADFDVFVNTTYASTCENRAPVGLYYVHFPGPAGTRRQRVLRRLVRVGASLLRRVETGKLAAVRVGLERRAHRTRWARSYTLFLANSRFTARWVKRMWKVRAELLYPPVQAEVLPGTKSTTIAAIGRFFAPELGHSKKQLDLVHAFTNLPANEWRLELIGGADAPSREYALAVRRAAVGHSIGVHFNAPRALVRDTLATASIFWHAGGFEEDPRVHPERFEHFGIAVVEAMAAGAVPVVFGAAGPAEIVRHGVDGFQWHTLAELVAVTRTLMTDDGLLAKMSASAQRRAADFSFERFADELRALVARVADQIT